MDAITQAAGEAQLELYRRMIDWDDPYRVEYGAELYACILIRSRKVAVAGFRGKDPPEFP